MRLFYYLLIVGCVMTSCKPASPVAEQVLQQSQTYIVTPTFNITLLDSVAGGRAIIQDTTNHFFLYISGLDMSIQMKQAGIAALPRAEQLAAYRAYLQADISNFTTTEAALLRKAFAVVTSRLELLDTNVLPQTIDLIKTHARHYDKSTYYTRQRSIIIPYDELRADNLANLIDILLHEVFHIYTRYHERQRTECYASIGFFAIDSLYVPPTLQARLLLNPDGVNPRFAIKLRDEQADTTYLAVPLLVSNRSSYQDRQTAFFDYVRFDLYPIYRESSGNYHVQTQQGWKSPIQYNNFPDFYRQIRRNTTYIIHPDEILADNFVLLVNRLNKIPPKHSISASGRELLDQLHIHLAEIEPL